MRAPTLKIFQLSLHHQLIVSWTLLISFLIVSGYPSRSSSLSTSETSISTSSFPSSHYSSVEASHVNNIILPGKATETLPPSSSSTTKSPVPFLSPSTQVIINGNQFPSMLVSFTFPSQKRDEHTKPINLEKYERAGKNGSLANEKKRNNIDINKNETSQQQQNQTSSYFLAKDIYVVFNSSIRGGGIPATHDTDKSDNQISSHHGRLWKVTIPFPPGKTKYKPNKHTVITNLVTMPGDDDFDAVARNRHEITKTLTISEGSGNSAGAFTPLTSAYFLFDRLRRFKRHSSNYQHAPLPSSSSSTAFPKKEQELLNKYLLGFGSSSGSLTLTSTTATTIISTNTAATEKTLFTKTAHLYHARNSNGEISSAKMMMPLESVAAPLNSSTRIARAARSSKDAGDTATVLTILGLFELTQNKLPRESGRSERIAAEMALEDINAKGILRGCRLIMHTNDTQCDPGTGVDAFFHAMYIKNESKIISLLGTACSEVTERLAKVATHKHIIQVSFGSTSPSLSDKKEFPLFYRTVAPVSSHSEAIIELIRHFEWDTVTFFTKNENRYTMPANFLVSELEKTNVTCKATLTFSISDYRDQLQDMKELDSRIIIANFGSDVAPLVFCEIYRMGMYGSDYAWILIGEPETAWWLEPPSTEKRSSTSTKVKERKTRRSKRNSNKSRGQFASSPASSSSHSTPTTASTTTPTSTFSSNINYQKQQDPSKKLAHPPDEFHATDEHLSYSDQSSSTPSYSTDGDSISIRMGRSLSFGGNRVSLNSESISSSGSKSKTTALNRNRTRNGKDPSAGTGSSVIRRLNSSSNPGTLRLKSSGKSLHQQQSHHHQSDCSFKQLMQAVQYAIVVDRYNILDQPSDSGMTTMTFRDRLAQRLKTESDDAVSPFAPETYDAVWTVALGLQRVQEKNNYNLSDYTHEDGNFSELLKSEIGKLNFSGISGPITFSGSDRIGITSFMQIQDGELVEVGLFFPDRPTNKLELMCKGCQRIRWHGNQVPISRREFRFKRVHVEYSLYIMVAIAASLGIIMAAGFLTFNLYNRKLKYIKLSSPNLNNIVIIGCMLAYLAVILLGTDFSTVPDGRHFAYICTVRAYLLSMAFSLAFGAMFAKTYRVYRIFTRSCIGVVKNKLLRDTQLMTLIMVLVLIDCIIVSSWAIFDPMHVNLRNLTLEIDPSDRTVVYQPQIEVCRSEHGHVWLSAMYGYKSLLLVVGLYMAWETRQVKIPALNDSKYIGLCVYTVVLTSVLAVSLANLISERVTVSFVSVTSLILFATTATLCLLFLPKIHAITKNPNASDPIVNSMGLKIECNTRRFIVEDTKELSFRAEVQNRVYKRQIEAVDVEIWRLENLLLHSPSKQRPSCSASTAVDAGIGTNNAKGGNKKAKRKSNEADDGEGEDEETSSDENDSTSEIYTVYLHGPKFIVPISLFNFRNPATVKNSYSCKTGDASQNDGTLASSSSSNAPRSSWPNSRYLVPPTNGLIAKKYRFKSEPRLQVEPPTPPSGSRSSGQRGKDGRLRISSIVGGLTAASNVSPPTIIQWGDGGSYDDDEPEIMGISGMSSGASSNISCNFLTDGSRNNHSSNSRKASTASGSESKRSSIFSAFKNPWSYITGFMSKPGNTNSSCGDGGVNNDKYSRRDVTGESSCFYTGENPVDGTRNDNFHLKPIPYFGGNLKSSYSASQQRQKFSSVPDLWAVRGSPDFDVNHKKYSVNSDTAAVGVHVINPSGSHEPVVDNPDPVLKLIVTSHESVYL